MHYDHAEPGTRTKSYRFLYNCLSRRIELNRQNSNRSALIANRGDEHSNRPGSLGPKAKAEERTSPAEGLGTVTAEVETPQPADEEVVRMPPLPRKTRASHSGERGCAREVKNVLTSIRKVWQPKPRRRLRRKERPRPGGRLAPVEPLGQKGNLAHYMKRSMHIR